jgi:hypothetical protein
MKYIMKYDEVIKSMIEIGVKATHCAFAIPEGDRNAALGALVAEAAPVILEAWRMFQEKRPGMPVRYFIEDLPKFILKARKNAAAAQEERLPPVYTVFDEFREHPENFAPPEQNTAFLAGTRDQLHMKLEKDRRRLRDDRKQLLEEQARILEV